MPIWWWHIGLYVAELGGLLDDVRCLLHTIGARPLLPHLPSRRHRRAHM